MPHNSGNRFRANFLARKHFLLSRNIEGTEEIATAFCGADLLDFGLVFFLGQGLSLRMDLEERKLNLSAYKAAMKTRTQTVMIMMGRGSFPLGGFIIP